MSNLLIREVQSGLKAKLQAEAEQLGRTPEEHARILLAEALGVAPADASHDNPGIEHIELVVDEGPSHDQSLREHTRVSYADIKARFTSDLSTKRFGLFTRYFSCEVIDISVRGARIQTTKTLHDQERITLYFTHSSGEKFSIHSKVVRNIRAHGDSHEFGVQFIDVLPQGNLRALICQKVIDQKFGH